MTRDVGVTGTLAIEVIRRLFGELHPSNISEQALNCDSANS